MKHLYFLLACLGLTTVYGQITYTSNNFAGIGANTLLSSTALNTAGYDFTQTGTNYAWNYPLLDVTSQDTQTWTDPNNSGYKTSWCFTNGYIFNCNSNFNNQFNLALPQRDGAVLGGYGLTNIVSHYQKNTTALTNKMFGAQLTVGANTVPVTVSYTVPDQEYKFPIQYNDNYTNPSSFSIDLNALGIPVIYQSDNQRTNVVEGWGSLVTPYGTFNSTLKMKTTIVSNITITTDAGPTNTTQTTISYKWFDPQYYVPVLEVTGNEINGVWAPTQITYVDIQRCLQPTAAFAYVPVLPDYDPATLSASVSFITGAQNYQQLQWDFGDGGTSTNQNPTHVYQCPGTYTVTLSAINTFCVPSVTEQMSMALVVTDSQNVLSNEVIVSDTSLTAVRDHVGTQYVWLDCNNNNLPIPGATGQVYTPTTSGSYAVSLVTGNCTSVSDCYDFPSLGTITQTMLQPKLYPNPTTGIVQVALGNAELKSVRVLDILGKVVANSLNLSALHSGLYLIELNTSKGVFVEKVVKQ
ncbi:MAG: PKD domain-containing protein [Flavobacteriaceae bacterium]